MNTRKLWVALVLSLFTLACANQAKHLRVQPIMYMDVSAKDATLEIPLPPLDPTAATQQPSGGPTQVASLTPSVMATTGAPAPGDDKLTVQCVRAPGKLSNEGTSRAQCLYVAIDYKDVLRLPVRNRFERNRLIDLLAGFSDANCDTFVHRVFANKAALDATRNTGAEMATAIAAGTAQVASGFSAGLGLFNLVGGTAIDNYNLVLFSDKTFQVVSAALDAERLAAQASLIEGAKKDLPDYTFEAALADLRRYDNTCSLRRALERLGELADNAKAEAQKALTTARGSELEEVRKELENMRSQRDTTQQLLNQAQTKMLNTSDVDERKALKTQVQDLLEQVNESNKKIEELRAAQKAVTTPQPENGASNETKSKPNANESGNGSGTS